MMADLIDIIKALGQENRLRILNLLNQQKLCVCELQNIMDENQSNISRHLNVLKNAGIISSEKDSLWIYYYLDKETLEEYPFIVDVLNNELEKVEYCQADNERLNLYQESNLDCSDLKDSDVFEPLEK
ncbi:winged helix-turn-helix transcriptional regulator [Halanaerobiaceae bacterium Z-7014]|uniref:Winged helix-turn-helix transcriptional regulator n=2 Tax=Halonatronomonas betaini TaxID=2778430 RepID=A0A931F9W9_9FIRM|nr:winged helix-turn-helix transcriptional regulator [Halonatronomonas betaini]